MSERFYERGFRVTVVDQDNTATSRPCEVDFSPKDNLLISFKSTPLFQQHIVPPPLPDSMLVSFEDNYATVNGELSNRSTLQKLLFEDNRLFPRTGHAVKHGSTWAMELGRNPEEGFIAEFGTGDPSIRIEFLGHPDSLSHFLLDQQQVSYDPTLMVSYPEGTRVRDYSLQRTILQTSGVETRTVLGHDYHTHALGPEPFSFQGKVMSYVEMRQSVKKKDSSKTRYLERTPQDVRVSIATVADNDQRLRVYSSSWCNILNRKTFYNDSHGHLKTEIVELKKAEKVRLLTRHLVALHELMNQDIINLDLIRDIVPQEVTEEQAELVKADTRRLRKFLLPRRSKKSVHRSHS